MKKSFYIFLCSMLGMMLFILLQRSIFLLLFLFGVDVLAPQFLKLDYTSFVVAMFFGIWYGIWVGLYWYQVIYEDATHGGIMSRLWKRVGGGNKVFANSGQSWNLEDLMKSKASEYTPPERLEPESVVYESKTIAFNGAPAVHAKTIHATALEVKPKPARKRTVRKTVKKAAK